MLILESFVQAVRVTALVFFMMFVIDLADVKSSGRFRTLMRGGRWRQYTTASFLGATPGCFGAFMNVSMYVHGFLTFGAVTAGMIATSGDEAFVMLAKFPLTAIALFTILFFLAIPLGRLADKLVETAKYVPCEVCGLHKIHADEKQRGHYLIEHIWQHIIKRHLSRVFLWTFLAILVVQVGSKEFSLNDFVRNHLALVLVVAALVGIIPESGPHLIFVMLFADGIIPFSVLLASSISQDGHGMLPLLSYSIRDAALIKAFNVGVALITGGIFYLLGW